MDETKVQIGEEVLLDIGMHSEWYISSLGYDGESVDITLRRKADRDKDWWQTERTGPEPLTDDDIETINRKVEQAYTVCGMNAEQTKLGLSLQASADQLREGIKRLSASLEQLRSSMSRADRGRREQ